VPAERPGVGYRGEEEAVVVVGEREERDRRLRDSQEMVRGEAVANWREQGRRGRWR
jgi:hypothetical protein